jgi:hypothetical protein
VLANSAEFVEASPSLGNENVGSCNAHEREQIETSRPVSGILGTALITNLFETMSRI